MAAEWDWESGRGLLGIDDPAEVDMAFDRGERMADPEPDARSASESEGGRLVPIDLAGAPPRVPHGDVGYSHPPRFASPPPRMAD
jgi:hypothetical protein